MTDTTRDPVLLEARFDERLKTYFLLHACFLMLITLFGVFLIPIWLLGPGKSVARRQYEALEAELTSRSLNLRRGFLVRIQKNIPLDKITDLAVHEGPILRRLGLCSLSIETAGGGPNTSMGQAVLPGVIDAMAFRDAVMQRRDEIVLEGRGGAPAATGVAAGSGPGGGPEGQAAGETLGEIRDGLQRIERLLEQRFSERS